MPRMVTYRCPDCKGEFDFMHHPADEPAPDRCEICGSWMGDEPEKAPVLYLKIGTAKNKVPDQVYRRMETASAERAADAADYAGASVSEMSAIKITDLKTNTRPGEHSAVTAPGPSPRQISAEAAQQNLSYQTPVGSVRPEFQNPQAAQWAEQTTSGPSALATRKIMDSMPHQSIIAQATAHGNDGKRH